ncbi:MAG: glutamine--fructose-6-phosphate transaminase (isomerizing) [Endozoicomonadaceae bacterium]|nr:glutamine--fructose-6-phosphate transaminase (isomerizing) [Endozoicomonadaceae bacterium]
MCGIIAGITQRNVVPILIEGLRHLEYRGYDSAGIAILTSEYQLKRLRCLGRVDNLSQQLNKQNMSGFSGIAHTRWATHGVLTENNAHPQDSHHQIMVVHNGIIENYEALKKELIALQYCFNSDTDTEVIPHLIHLYHQKTNSLLKAVQLTVKKLQGIFSLVVLDEKSPDCLVAYHGGSPLMIGIGIEEHFIASDPLALSPLTNRFQFLEKKEIAIISQYQVSIYNDLDQLITRAITHHEFEYASYEKGHFRYFMLKEIYDQPHSILKALQDRIAHGQLDHKTLAQEISLPSLAIIEHIHIVACGTSYHAALVAKYWFESIDMPCHVEIASEFRYRTVCVPKHCLFLALSQSGETADTLAALRIAKTLAYCHSIAICNIATSSLVRESDMVFLMHAGAEIGVASTKAFTTQLVVLLLLMLIIGRQKKTISIQKEQEIIVALQALPSMIDALFKINDDLKRWAAQLMKKSSVLFLGRSTLYPIAMEGALKLKEISYIHAEAYAAGELKHGPLALVDEDMPVIVLVRQDALLPKLKSNIEAIKSRKGQLYLITDYDMTIDQKEMIDQIMIPAVHPLIAPIVYTIPLQILAYEVAVLKGTDIDQPRNLAKSVTVE